MEQSFTVAEFNHLLVHVRDLDASVAFYRMFGPVEKVPGRNTPVSLGPATRLLLHHDPEYTPPPQGNLDHIALVLEGSPDVQGVVDHVRAYGAEPFDGPRDDGRGYTQFYIRDPDGNQIEMRIKNPPFTGTLA